MTRPRPSTSTLFPYTTLFRSSTRRFSASKSSEGLVRRSIVNRQRSGTLLKLVPASTRPPTSRIDSSTSRSEEHTSELQSPYDLVCRLLLEKKKNSTREQEYVW